MNHEQEMPYPCMAGDDCHRFSAPAAVDAEKFLPSGPIPLPVKMRSRVVPFPDEGIGVVLPRIASVPDGPLYLITRRLRL
ncbi:hypothetical protein [Thiohalomonas denitrificans]|uniref:Uncharacterized protein n=1 Tax=Thiohalomonas denitrificans TaxID=415747 RepID=A0A1G5QBJ7_9GAMM|nr:hypothetical protein [Thiohalomonas denitrificans]SCZ59032.1 hypothetical protein SAMN03097708_01772 [Thiohalomonas denitrificans]